MKTLPDGIENNQFFGKPFPLFPIGNGASTTHTQLLSFNEQIKNKITVRGAMDQKSTLQISFKK